MKILVIGGSGEIGKATVSELSKRHEVLVAGRNSGSIACDMASKESIEEMYRTVGPLDAVAIAAGKVHFEEFSRMDSAKYRVGIDNKLMGQVLLVQIGSRYLKERGSFTLISGILGHDPVKGSAASALVNGAIEAFVRAAAIELPNQLRINAVCPTLLTESVAKLGAHFPGFPTVPGAKVALAYVKSIEGLQTGQVYSVY